jgi:hypothetical protein
MLLGYNIISALGTIHIYVYIYRVYQKMYTHLNERKERNCVYIFLADSVCVCVCVCVCHIKQRLFIK